MLVAAVIDLDGVGDDVRFVGVAGAVTAQTQPDPVMQRHVRRLRRVRLVRRVRRVRQLRQERQLVLD